MWHTMNSSISAIPSQIVPLVKHARSARIERGQMRNIQIPRVLHPFAQDCVSDRAEQNEQKKQHVRFRLDEFSEQSLQRFK